MPRNVIFVCIFCLICATHSPCSSHADTRHLIPNKDYQFMNDPPTKLKIVLPEKKFLKRQTDYDEYNDGGKDDYKDYIKKLFEKFGDGDKMSLEGLRQLVAHLRQGRDGHNDHEHDHDHHHHHHSLNDGCFTNDQISQIFNKKPTLNQSDFHNVCPNILYNLISEQCNEINDNIKSSTLSVNTVTWLCSMGAVILISACGVLALAIIPVMQKWFYKPLIQFLVALAVGTLAGDALLHLLPHSMSSNHDEHDLNTKRGCVAMLGLTFFFVMERLILLAGKWRKRHTKHAHSHVTVISERRESVGTKNNMQCMDKYNTMPFCYKDITDNTNFAGTATTTLDQQVTNNKKSRSPSSEKSESNRNDINTECAENSTEYAENSTDCAENSTECTENNKMLETHKHDEDYTVILREHRTDHHGHSHKHGHVHSAPRNFSSVVWMVIMGDGLHNFTDGMAIGAAFSAGIAGGFSTTVAVFCHELPHELGDFAMLLKAGMSVKQALFYNILSSVLCVFGNIFGLYLGNTEYASSWLFAAAAGMFLYIALVDMIPELSSSHEDEGNILQCLLHLGGLLTGFGIMALIALYEHDLKTIFNDPE